MSDVRLDWRGDEVKRQVMENVAKAFGEYALTVEGESKKELRRGHGVLYGVLRRSIHAALPSYDWSSDDSSDGGPERGGSLVEAEISENSIAISVGSGLVYAMAIHQGWPLGYKGLRGQFEGYHYITNGDKKARPKLPSILEKYKVQR